MKNKGKLIIIEGTDGSGKGTQLELLYKRLQKQKYKVSRFDFPQYGKTFFGHLVGRFLKGEFGGIKDVDPHLASLPYALDRWQAKPKIEKELSKGKIVISNRYVMSSMAHQTAKLPPHKREAFLNFISELEYGVLKLPQEDAYIYLRVSPEINQSLIDKKKKRKYIEGAKRDIHENDKKHLIEAAKIYELLSKKLGNVITLDCSDIKGQLKSVEEIHEEVWKTVTNLCK